MFQKRINFFRSILCLGDLCLVIICWVYSYLLNFYYPIIQINKIIPDIWLYFSSSFLVLIIFAIAFQAINLYRNPWIGVSLAQTFWLIIIATTIGVVLSIIFIYLACPYEFNWLIFIYFYIFLIEALLLYRSFLRWLWSHHDPKSTGRHVLIVGNKDLGKFMAQKIHKNPMLGLRVIGFLSYQRNTKNIIEKNIDGFPILGHYTQIQKVLTQYQVQLVIIALPLSCHEAIREVIDNIANEMVDVKIVADYYHFISLHSTIEKFEGLPIISLRNSPLEGWAGVAKRTLDICGSLFLLALFSPFMILAAIIIKLTSSGPIFYRQERMGLNGQLFQMIKLRTMRIDAEDNIGPIWCQPKDPRRTAIGIFLRATSLDETPQFINVLKGEMSLVGPRPERPTFIAEFKHKVPHYMLRHKVKAGLTGWAQINGWRGNTSLERRVEYDLFYIENWSFILDLKILAMTPFRGLIHPHAY